MKSKPRLVHHISIKEFYESYKDLLKLKLVAGEKGLKGHIREESINRPSLALTGFFKYFASKRIQLFGAGEMGYLRVLAERKQYMILNEILSKNVPCMIVSRNLAPTKPMLTVAQELKVPLFRSTLTSRELITMATILLDEAFAPQITEHGTMMDIAGLGTLIRGDSGLGKSECSLALIERGHSLVADDSVYIKLINERELMATSSKLNRGYMECRGLGIINIGELFGIRALRLEKRIDLVVTFIEWQAGQDEERTGLDQAYYNILDTKVPHFILPIRPGRDFARLVEVAAMVQSLKRVGHDPAKEFNERLIRHMADK